MRDAIEKADVLIEALGWIRQFRDQVTVIKLGGSVMEDAEALRHLLVDIVFMETVGMRPVVVHGGGAAISRAMDEAQKEQTKTASEQTGQEQLAALRASNCEIAERNLAELQRPRGTRYHDTRGNRIHLNAEQRAAGAQTARTDVEQYCD